MLFEKLKDNAKAGTLPMHMPGHKRNTSMLGNGLPYNFDITEINGFDDLHEMSGILRKMAESAAALYGAKTAFPMVNGTTGGILAAIRASCREPGGSIVMSRFSHRSVYNAAEICALSPVYIIPEQENGIPLGISKEEVERTLAGAADVRCVVLTSPTYEGAVSEIDAIARMTKARGVPLIVDAAHGAHFGFSEHFPQNAVRLGADIELVSLHKTLPALTQSSLALVGSDSIVTAAELSRQLRVFETSSPSYILLASIDRCIELLYSDGHALLEAYAENLKNFKENMSHLKHLKIEILHCKYGYDIGKVIISTINSNITGNNLRDLLRSDYNIELEMATVGYGLAMTSICDTRDSLGRLAAALVNIDEGLSCGESIVQPFMFPQIAFAPYEAQKKNGVPIPLEIAEGRIVLEHIWAYPPGIPLLVPGEIVDGDVIRHLIMLETSGTVLRSDYGRMPFVLCSM